MNVLVVDIGGTNVKILATGQTEPRKFPSGPVLEPARIIAGVKELAGEWKYDAVSFGYPGPILRGSISRDPHNLAPGRAGVHFDAALRSPAKLPNDPPLQAPRPHP